jgi:thiamine biosynthesis lipoprotein
MDVMRYPFQAMGTACTIHIQATSEAVSQQAAALAAREIYRLELCYSRYDRESYLSRLNTIAHDGGSLEVDPETATLIDRAFELYHLSGGLFDITSGVLRRGWNDTVRTIPDVASINALLEITGLQRINWRNPVLSFPTPGMQIDFGGIVKEYAADCACAILSCFDGVISAMVELGGDISVTGRMCDGEGWNVAIRDPRNRNGVLAVVTLQQGGLATSGDYERYLDLDGRRFSHILDPLSGWPVDGLASVSVVASTCQEAGSLSTIALLKGWGASEWLNHQHANYMAVDQAGGVSGPLSSLPPFG